MITSRLKQLVTSLHSSVELFQRQNQDQKDLHVVRVHVCKNGRNVLQIEKSHPKVTHAYRSAVNESIIELEKKQRAQQSKMNLEQVSAFG